ncbi:MAG TPA: DNA gyrase inhibitor YacG [Allosphingosinicella sp.]|nr:DNA gyrase inhibitor YacG [Allosphingosinicella sp.]
MSTAKASDRRQACTLCGKPASPEHKPFCSQGCRDRDLLNWLGDAYKVPGDPVDPHAFGIEEDGLDSGR